MTASSPTLALDYVPIRKLAGGSLSQSQVDGFDVIFWAFDAYGDGKARSLAYILGTAWHETGGTMQPVREAFATSDAQAIDRLSRAFKSGKLKWVKIDYWSGGFFGRGYVQLTHEDNYRRVGKLIGADLIKSPQLALIPAVAGRILVQGMIGGWFTGKALADYPNDFIGARRIVNGTDKAKAIADYAGVFLGAIKDAVPAVAPTPHDPPVLKPIPPKSPPEMPPDDNFVETDAVSWVVAAILILAIVAVIAALFAIKP